MEDEHVIIELNDGRRPARAVLLAEGVAAGYATHEDERLVEKAERHEMPEQQAAVSSRQ